MVNGPSLANEIVALVAGITTTFLIPWADKKLHLNIPADEQTKTEVEEVLEEIINKHSPPTSPLVTDLGTNPFTTAPKPAPPTNEIPPSENGAM